MEKEAKIKLPEAFKLSAKITKRLDAFTAKISKPNMIHWEGDYVAVNLFYLYLLNKYKSKCLVFHNYDPNYSTLGLELNVSNDIINEADKLIFREISRIIVNCIKRGEKTIIIPLSLKLGRGGGHANVLIYRKNDNVIEHFEPHGRELIGFKDNVDLKLTAFISELNKILLEEHLPTIIFKAANDVCPYIQGLQVIESAITDTILDNGETESSGYCSAWTMFFTELALKNPTISSDKLLDLIYNLIKKKKRAGPLYLRNVIRGYVLFISEKIEEYFSILYKNKINVEDINKNLQNKDYTSHMEYRRKINKFLIDIIELEMKILNNPNFDRDREIEALESSLPFGGYQVEKSKNQIFLYKNLDKLTRGSPLTSSPPETVVNSNPKICPPGKEINERTGRCVKIKTEKKKKEKLASDKTKTMKICPPGKEINERTGRCVKIKTKK